MTFRSSHWPLLFSVFSFLQLEGQSFSYASSRYEDDLTQWIVFDTLDQEAATLDFARMPADAFKTWNLRINDRPGNIKLRWRENPDEWDYRRDEILVSMKPVWPSQRDQWSLQNGGKRYELAFRRQYEGLVWELSDDKGNTVLEIENAHGLDPRDWNFTIDSALSDDLCLAAFFIVSRYSTGMTR